MGWEKRSGKETKFHDHTLTKYKRKRKYIPDFVTREEWGAEPPWDMGERLPHPVKYVKVYFTETEPCNSLSECVQVIQDLQKTHVEMGLVDIAWNFVVGGDGRKYEGRGWLVRSQTPWKVKQSKRKSVTIAVVGNMDRYGEGITDYMQDGIADLINFGICNRYIDCCYETVRELFLNSKTIKVYRY